jgi:hypothetical protein
MTAAIARNSNSALERELQSAFWFSKHSRRSQEKHNKRKRVMIRVIVSSSGIRVTPKLEGARVRKEKAARNGSTKVSHNTKEVGIVDLSRRRTKLT